MKNIKSPTPITNSFAALEAKAKEIRDASKEKAQAKLDTLFCPDLSKTKGIYVLKMKSDVVQA